MSTVIKQAQLGETIANQSWGYIKISDGKVWNADAAAAASQAAFFIYAGGDADDYVQIIYGGEMELPGAGLTVGAYYFLDPATPGAHTITQGTGAYQQLFKAIDTDRILIDIKAAVPAAGGGGGDSLGTGFTSGGGSGTIPDNTVATCDGDFDLDGGFSGFNNKLMFSPAGILDYVNFIGIRHDDDNYVAGFQNVGNESEFNVRVSVKKDDNISTLNVMPGTISFQSYNSATSARAAFDANSSTAAQLIFDGVGYVQVGVLGIVIQSLSEEGAIYDDDYSATIITNDRSIPDVGTVRDSMMPLMFPAQLSNAAAANGQLYYSTDDLALAYKDPGGTVNLLYP